MRFPQGRGLLPSMKILLILASWSLLLSSVKAEVDIRGFLWGRAKMRLKGGRDFIQQETWLRLELQKRLEGAGLFVDLDLRYDPLYQSEPKLDLREAYIDLSFGLFDLRIGKQIIVWGRADEFNPTDFINPEDYREFLFLNKADRKIGVFYSKLDYYMGNFKLEGIFIPTFTPASIPTDPTYPWTHYQIKEILANPFVSLDEPQKPEPRLKNSEYALKFGAIMSGFDFSISYYEGFFDLPVMSREITPFGIHIRPEYRRFRAWGFDFASSLGGLGLRGELAYVHKAYHITNDPRDADGVVRKPDLSFVLGADYTLLEDLYLNLQWVQRLIFDYQKGIDEDRIENRLVLFCHKEFLDEEMEVGFSGMIYNLGDGDYMLRPYFKYSVADGVSLEVGCCLFGGGKRTMFGQFDQNDCGFIKVVYYF